MNMFSKLFFTMGKSIIRKKLTNDTFKSKIVSMINKKVDIPNLTEAQEKKLFEAVIDAICNYLKVK